MKAREGQHSRQPRRLQQRRQNSHRLPPYWTVSILLTLPWWGR